MPPFSRLISPTDAQIYPAPLSEAASDHSTLTTSPTAAIAATAYTEYRRDGRTQRLLDRRPNSPGPDYSGLILGSCRAGTFLNRARIVSQEEGEDVFTPDQIRSLIRLLGYPEDTSALVLDQDRSEAGQICVELSDRRWGLAMLERLEARCEREVRNAPGCEALLASLREALHEKTPWENFLETLPVGTGFFVPGALAAGLGMLARSLWNRFRGGPPPAPPGSGSGETEPGRRRSESSSSNLSRSALALGLTLAADRALTYLSQTLPSVLSRIGAMAEASAAVAAGALFVPIFIHPSCASQIGQWTNPQCGEGA